MNRERPLLLASTGALVLEALAGFLLLAVSVWFISACAVAGQAGSAVNFNYIAPATVIRLLAILRIAAGYGDRYLGHLLLLQRLARRRRELLAAVFASDHGPEHARATATLQQAAEDWAARYAAVVAPQVAATLLFGGLLVFVGLLLPELAGPLLLLAVVLLLLRLWLLRTADRFIRTREAQAEILDRSLEGWLRGSSLWSLRSDWSDDGVLQGTALRYARSRRQLDGLITRGEDLLLAAGLVTAVALLYAGRDLPATPLATVPVLVLAALRDWLRPALVAAVRGRDTRHSSRRMCAAYPGPAAADLPAPGAAITPIPAVANGLHLRDFRWQRGDRAGPPMSADLPGPGLYLLSGSSGTGKSSLLAALAGELPYTGSARLDDRELRDLDRHLRSRIFYLAEQFGHVFSDTLAHNLRLAAPDASEQDMLEALRWSGFAGPDATPDLRQWLGEQGRPLSGGERKRLLLARAFMIRAPVWLLDEPFEGLEETLSLRIADRLNEVAQSHLVIMATHQTPPSLRIRGTMTCD